MKVGIQLTRVVRSFATLVAGVALVSVFGQPHLNLDQPEINLVRCGSVDQAAIATPFTWSRTYEGRCAHVAGGKHPQTYVEWNVPSFSDGHACVQAMGYRWSDGKRYWQSLGCGTSGGGAVHWGKSNVGTAAPTRIQALSQNAPLGSAVRFTD